MWHLLADVHFDIKTLPRLQSFFDFYLKRLEQTRPQHILFLGDTFNVRTGTDAHLHRVFSDYLLRMLDAPQSPQIHLLVGNHDMKNRYDRFDNALYPFSLVRSRVKVYQEITRARLDGYEAVFIPYHHDEAQVARYIQTQPSSGIRSTIAFFHGSFRGAIQNGASDSSHAVCHNSVIDRTNLGRYRRAFLGHFHTHGSPPQCSNVTYVGSPIQSNMGDAGDLKRGYVEYDPKEDTWDLVVNPEAEYYLSMSWSESVDQPHRVRGKKVRLDTADQGEGAWTNETVQRHIDNMYSHGAHHVEQRQATKWKNNYEPLLEAGEGILLMEQELRDNALSPQPSMVDLVESFLHAEPPGTDSADMSNMDSLTQTRKNYLLPIIHDHHQQHGVATPATTFHADLLKIEMCNFRGVSGNTCFDLDALSRGAVFLVASGNGNGKSTLLEAIFWCLYGKFLDPDVSAEEAVHSGKRSCSVALCFRNGYTFTRSRAGKRPKFEISYQGEVVEHGHDAATTTQYLESHLLHMTSETFRRTIVIADHVSSAFLAVRDTQRAQSLDIMFGMDVLREYRTRLEQESKETKRRWNEVQADCDKVSEALKALEYLCQKSSRELDEWKTTVGCKKRAIQALRRRSEEMQGRLEQIDESVQKSRLTMETLKGEIAQLRHQVKLYQTMERVKWAQAEVDQYYAALAREEKRQKEIWVQFCWFVNRLDRHYLIPLINTISYVVAQLPWLNRLLAPLVRRSLTQRPTWASPPTTKFSHDGLRKPKEQLQKAVAQLHVLTQETSQRSKDSRPRHKVAHPHDRHEHVEEQVANSYSVNVRAFHSMDELQLPQISKLGQQAEEFFQVAEQKQMRIQALLTADESDRSAQSQQIHEISVNIARQDGQLEEMVQQEHSRSLEAEHLMQQHKDLLLRQKKSMDERSQIEAERALSTFWLEQLQDTATQKGPFITFCRARHIHSLNATIAQVLNELNQDSEGIATAHLEFQLQPDYSLVPIHGALSMGKRSRGQKTRTYLALFLAMFQHTRARLPFRSSFVFLDEVMDTLDLPGIEALQRWLQRYVAARGMQAFLMTHRETSLLGKVIEVVKDRKRGTVYKLRQEEETPSVTG